MGSLRAELENVRKAVGDARRQASPESHRAPVLGTAMGGILRAPSALMAQQAALEAIQRLIEELTDAVQELQRNEGGNVR